MSELERLFLIFATFNTNMGLSNFYKNEQQYDDLKCIKKEVAEIKQILKEMEKKYDKN